MREIGGPVLFRPSGSHTLWIVSTDARPESRSRLTLSGLDPGRGETMQNAAARRRMSCNVFLRTVLLSVAKKFIDRFENNARSHTA